MQKDLIPSDRDQINPDIWIASSKDVRLGKVFRRYHLSTFTANNRHKNMKKCMFVTLWSCIKNRNMLHASHCTGG